MITKSERKTTKAIERLERAQIERLIDRIVERGSRRRENEISQLANPAIFISMNEWHWLSDTEKSILHTLKLALITGWNDCELARERIKARIAQRRVRRKTDALSCCPVP